MSQHEAGLVFHMIHEPEPELAICQNPKGMDVFTTDDDAELFCPACERELESVEKASIRYAIEHDMIPAHVLGHIMNGGL
jgi:predicted Zn-dependent protease